jgi:hypothetical protein
LALTVGMPFFLLAATGPLLQRWFAGTTHPDAKDPYFLYAASNLGSMLALLSYPFLFEPAFTVSEQSQMWSVGYGVVLALTCGCAVATCRQAAPGSRMSEAQDPSERVTIRRRLRWLALAFVPSSLLLGVTSYLTNDIGSVPLLWVLPLSLYLLSFIIAFARRQIISPRTTAILVPGSVIVVTILLLSDAMQPPVGIWMTLHLVVFFILSLFCHTELARDRPGTRHLTRFYLWLALGGVWGGAFNALAAPLLFNRVLEYPLAVVLVCLLRRPGSSTDGSRGHRTLDWLLPVGIGMLVALLITVLRDVTWNANQLKIAVMFGLPALVCYWFVDRPLRFALGIAAIYLAAFLVDADPRGTPVRTQRSFFGVLRVTRQQIGADEFHALVHGNTFHGRQRLNGESRPEPLSYYHPSGPIGHFFQRMQPWLHNAHIGVIGLGVGSVAAFAEPGQYWAFYEIDPAIVQIACNSALFQFLQTSKVTPEIVLGDARLRLQDAPDGHYDVLILDAFSSDAVPVHLLTREALALYLAKLKPHGVILFHISNRYLDLKPVLAALAKDAGLVSRYFDDFTVDPAHVGKDPSQWVLMVRTEDDLGPLKGSARWFALDEVQPVRVWTDDYSNILSVVRWGKNSD